MDNPLQILVEGITNDIVTVRLDRIIQRFVQRSSPLHRRPSMDLESVDLIVFDTTYVQVNRQIERGVELVRFLGAARVYVNPDFVEDQVAALVLNDPRAYRMAQEIKALFSDVNDTKDTWTVHAKVLRKWVVRRKAAPYAVWKISMLLVDEEVALTMIEVTATHKNLIERWTDEPKEGVVYKFQNFQVLENDDKYRVTTHQWRFNFHTYTYFEESDLVILGEAYNFMSITDIQHRNVTDGGLIDQKREYDIVKRLNFSIADESENLININLWGECTEETYAKKKEDMEPPIIVLVHFTRLNRNTEYGHLSNAFNATLVTLNPQILEASLLKERLSQDSAGSQLFTQISSVDHPTYSYILLPDLVKIDHDIYVQRLSRSVMWLRKSPFKRYKIHYKVYDDTGKSSIIFFDRHGTELLGKSASKIREEMHKEGRNSTVPEELDKVSRKVAIVKLKIKSHNIKHKTSSIGVTQFCGGTHLIEQFQYSNLEAQFENVVEESTASKDSQTIAVGDDGNSMAQLITPPDGNIKRKTLTADIMDVREYAKIFSLLMVAMPQRRMAETSTSMKVRLATSESQLSKSTGVMNLQEFIAARGNPPVYAQLYIYDTDNEISNRISTVSRNGGGENLDPGIVKLIKGCLDKYNSIVKQYRSASKIIKHDVVHDVNIRLIRNSSSSGIGPQYNMPTASELAALIVGDFDNSYTNRDIIVKRQSRSLQRIDELHMSYLPLQYPLFFHYGDNGYDPSIEHGKESLLKTKKKTRLTPRSTWLFDL
ncbi:hypothetical protein K1719_036940 [Acacia pycnantha]|nr:hypothetical protein K1719_036940 [Acacia pycnantha]